MLNDRVHDVKDVWRVAVCNRPDKAGPGYHATVEFLDVSVSHYRLPTAGDVRATRMWTESHEADDAGTDANSSCFGFGRGDTPAPEIMLDRTCDSGVKTTVLTRLTARYSFSALTDVWLGVATTVRQAEAEHKGFVAPDKSWGS